MNPLTHYDQFGWKEGRDPSAAFDTSAYLAANRTWRRRISIRSCTTCNSERSRAATRLKRQLRTKARRSALSTSAFTVSMP